MKELIENYYFDPTAGTLELTDETTIRLEQILLITDKTTGEIVFDGMTAGLGGTVATNTLTFELDVSDLDADDSFEIWFWRYGAADVSIDAIKALVGGVETDSILALPGRREDSFNEGGETANATTAVAIKAGVPGKSIYITDASISVDTAGWVRLVDSDGTFITRKKFLQANATWTAKFNTSKKVVLGKGVSVLAQNAGNIGVDVDGYVI